MRNHDFLVAGRRRAGAPVGNGDIRPLARQRRDFFRHGMRAYQGFQERIAGQAVRAMQAGASHFAAGKQAGHLGGAIHAGGDAAAEIMRRRHHGDQVARHVDAELQAGGENIREAAPQKLLGLEADIQVDTAGAAGFHGMVNGAGHHVARRQRAARIVMLHKRLASRIHQQRSLAPHGFADQK